MNSHGLDRIVDTEWGRRPGTLKLAYHAVDSDGITQQVWGVEVDGDLPLNPWTLRDEVGRLPWPEVEDEALPKVEVLQIEHRSSAAQMVVQYVVEALPAAFIGAAVSEGLRALLKKLQPWSKSKWNSGPKSFDTREEILAYATRRALEIACDACRDIPDDPPDIHVLSQFMPPTSSADGAAPTIVLRTSEGEHITIQIWMSDAGEQYSITRSR